MMTLTTLKALANLMCKCLSGKTIHQGCDEANPKTIVVLIGDGPVDMSPWVNDVQGIIQAWYPGMEGRNAPAKSDNELRKKTLPDLHW